MKLVKTLVLTTALTAVAFSASATKNFEGGYVGGQLGTSKGSKAKTSTLDSTNANVRGSFGSKAGFSHKTEWGLHGGILGGYRTAVAQDVVLGASLGVDFESTKHKNSYEATPTNKASGEAKRKYIVNLLGQAGYTVTKDFMPFVTAGISYAQFKLDNTDPTPSNGGSGKTKGKFGFVAGVGAAYAINHTVSTDLTYTYTSYGKIQHGSRSGSSTTTVTTQAPKAYHAVVVGVKVNI